MAVKDVTRRAEWWVPGRSNHHFFGSSDFLVKLKSLEGVGIGLRQAGRLIGHMSTSVEQLHSRYHNKAYQKRFTDGTW